MTNSDLRKFLKANGLSLTWLAEQLKMQESLLRYHAQRGLSEALEGRIKAILKRLGVSLAMWPR